MITVVTRSDEDVPSSVELRWRPDDQSGYVRDLIMMVDTDTLLGDMPFEGGS
jgi:hypothetical protein